MIVSGKSDWVGCWFPGVLVECVRAFSVAIHPSAAYVDGDISLTNNDEMACKLRMHGKTTNIGSAGIVVGAHRSMLGFSNTCVYPALSELYNCEHWKHYWRRSAACSLVGCVCML